MGPPRVMLAMASAYISTFLIVVIVLMSATWSSISTSKAVLSERGDAAGTLLIQSKCKDEPGAQEAEEAEAAKERRLDQLANLGDEWKAMRKGTTDLGQAQGRISRLVSTLQNEVWRTSDATTVALFKGESSAAFAGILALGSTANQVSRLLADASPPGEETTGDPEAPEVSAARSDLEQLRSLASDQFNKLSNDAVLGAGTVAESSVSIQVVNVCRAVTIQTATLFLAALAGALGGLLDSAGQLVLQVSNKRWKQKWLIWYLFRPFTGIGFALLIHALLRSGLLGIENGGLDEVNAAGIVTFSGLTGLFSAEALAKLRNVFRSVFSVGGHSVVGPASVDTSPEVLGADSRGTATTAEGEVSDVAADPPMAAVEISPEILEGFVNERRRTRRS